MGGIQHLSDSTYKNAKCSADKARARFTDAGGLYLEVVPSGGKHWRWKYRFGGKEKRLALGTHPLVTLAIARGSRDDARLLLKSGTDPVAAKQDLKRVAKVSLETTLEPIARAPQCGGLI